ncbi:MULTISPECIES: HlyD family type I secretion periplasmic adaptor subunit [unclassified Bradyrhizobium]|uniref:HlyD family type I secretion periplasmic adaptor subunit n=1 Tax=unclassified Bradyrhizobium TaxID=2631580 RepID=UPI00070ED895|nr:MULTISPECIES: HlyD family type I secretion periplasmic adaptor subunit [unclassified Bradyrhizobium]KQT20807.1 hemolysin secretion protein D [Bradyrhizobium sp. Leaf396]
MTGSADLHRSVRRHLLLSLVGAALLLGGFGGWATTAELAGAVVASGSLVVRSSVKKVQHPTGGVVGELRAHEGDVVSAGDVLIRLDETVTRANLAAVENSLIELYVRQARLIAERDAADTVEQPSSLRDFSDEARAAKVLAGERRLFELRQASRAGQKAQLREKIGQITEQIQGLNEQIAGKKQEVELINRELVGVRELWAKSLIPIQRMTALERDAARIKGEHGQLMASTAEAKGKVSEIQLQIIQVDQDLRSEVAKELRETEGKIGELVEKRVAAQDQLNRIDIRSPQSGIVHQLSVHTIGGVISPGEQLMLIVPQADVLVVEARIAPKDIDEIRLRQPAILRFTAFNQRTTPEVGGTVTLVGADEINDEKSGKSYFKVQITPSPEDLDRLKHEKLVPGMPVEAFVQTASRTALSYFAKPISDQLTRAFREQ